MIDVTTEIGKPGRKEREKRHFPATHNQPGPIFPPEARGRRYIPHGRGVEGEWRPHNQNIDIQYTKAGPDWSSKLKYLPPPDNPEYPAAEIWPDNWKSIRPYPHTYKRSQKEWLLDPDLTKLGLRCLFGGVHKASATSDSDFIRTMLFGHRRHESNIDKRNSLTEASPGDKSYQVPEYSPSFHNTSLQDAAPKFRIGNSLYLSHPKKSVNIFVPLMAVPRLENRPSYRQKMVQRQRKEEVTEVKNLELWQPAKPISTTMPGFEPMDIKK